LEETNYHGADASLQANQFNANFTHMSHGRSYRESFT